MNARIVWVQCTQYIKQSNYMQTHMFKYSVTMIYKISDRKRNCKRKIENKNNTTYTIANAISNRRCECVWGGCQITIHIMCYMQTKSRLLPIHREEIHYQFMKKKKFAISILHPMWDLDDLMCERNNIKCKQKKER